MNLKSLLAAFAGLMFSFSALASDFAQSTPAVWGYDVVSYHVNKRPVRGSGHYVVTHDGATYLFSTLENKETFAKNPAKYVPAYNGYCAYGVAKGKKFAGDPEVWRIVDGTLYLNLDSKIQDLWLSETDTMIKDGDSNWKRIKNADPANL
ncbi:YHS domain-containing (seleno)protein [Parahaliea mediterranea]|uniref:YHS domain-containing protein n=1 Tax=Parahaliea mediterranea TaxID=651086 RepID=A0A939DE73_9GAMM|nr:YHS domain-containing (seleno)protein [Parahaliea mediterranea]MBN7795867.1 YHS domain-containing protein [Parahaliea mediterranea]